VTVAYVSGNCKTGNQTLFFTLNGKRTPIWLGAMSKRDVSSWKHHVEELVEAKMQGRTPMPETSQWVANLDLALHKKLVGGERPDGSRVVGLVEPREEESKVIPVTLEGYLADYTARRSDVKASTATVYGHTRRCLVAFFGAEMPLTAITPGRADDFARWLRQSAPKGQELAENTARRRLGIAKQFFRAAVRDRLIESNPFADQKGVGVLANRDRDRYVTPEEAKAVLDACPDAQWKLIFALSRYGGLRCPSEHLALRWGDIDFELGRIDVRASKTEHHVGKGVRTIPLFDELRPLLQTALDELLETFDPKANRLSEQPVITRFRSSTTNLRTQLERIILRAKIQPWPKLFQNLRSSLATDLSNNPRIPDYVAASWLGHSVLIANRHYRQVLPEHFDAVTGNPMRQSMRSTAATNGQETPGETEPQLVDETASKRRVSTSLFGNRVGDTGLEPVTSAV
jgi:integrase